MKTLKSKLILKLSVVLLLAHFSRGQEFSFPLYFEDVLGNKDTLILGYDPGATDSIDTNLGEINMITIPFDTVFEVRISGYNYTGDELIIPDPSIFHTKKQIKLKTCNWFSYSMVAEIILRCKNYPLKVSWDKTLFTDTCRQKSFITDWHPGGWFDASYGIPQGPFFLSDSVSVIFTPTTHHYITTTNDTIDVLFFIFTPYITYAVNENQVEERLNIFPNPSGESIQIKTKNENLKGDDLFSIYNVRGEKVIEKQLQDYETQIDISALPRGVYFVKMQDENMVEKMIKQ